MKLRKRSSFEFGHFLQRIKLNVQRNQGRDSSPAQMRPKSPSKGSLSDDVMAELNEYSSDEGGAGRMRRRSSGSDSNQSRDSDHELMGPKVPDNLIDHDIELPPSIESNQSEQSDEEDDIDIRVQLLIPFSKSSNLEHTF